MPGAFIDEVNKDEYDEVEFNKLFEVKNGGLIIKRFALKMADYDPLKYDIILKTKTINDYLEWLANKMLDYEIDKYQMNKMREEYSIGDGEEKKGNIYSRDEVLEMMKNGEFDK